MTFKDLVQFLVAMLFGVICYMLGQHFAAAYSLDGQSCKKFVIMDNNTLVDVKVKEGYNMFVCKKGEK